MNTPEPREFESTVDAHAYATRTGGTVELIETPGMPHYYVVTPRAAEKSL